MQQTKGSWADVPHIKQAVRKVFHPFANRSAVPPSYYDSIPSVPRLFSRMMCYPFILCYRSFLFRADFEVLHDNLRCRKFCSCGVPPGAAVFAGCRRCWDLARSNELVDIW